jgi:phosphoribosylformylglycinamidine synthase
LIQVEITPEIIAEHGVSPEEYQTILEILGREPNITELGIFSVMWSEHCSYKNSKPLLITFPTTGDQVLQGPGENAGIVDFDEKYAIAFKMESHNHPSALEPYQGAATGVGGILRDIFTMGARPIALLDPLRFGDPADARTRHIIKGVVEGIADYGNAVGVPTIGGECVFSPAYNGNPLVNVMCLGLIEKDKITRAVASGAGNLVVYYGNSTGRDGIHGATFASTELTEESEDRRSAVQVGDPFTEKKILEATLELIDANACVAIQDMGAAGLTCSCAEMAGRGGMGIEIELNNVPQRAENLSAYEMMLSESQERMLAIVEPEKLELARGILRKWDLDAHVLGTLDASGLMKVRHNGVLEAELPADKVSDNSPVYHRQSKKPEYMESLPDARKFRAGDLGDLQALLLEFLSSPNICSKSWIYQQYDHMVQTQTVTRPGDNAPVLKVHGTKHYVSAATDGNGLYCYVDPYEGGKLAVAESARNVACTGAQPLAITNCLNFGSPLKPEVFFQIAEAVRGIGDACRALNTPVTGGNVSLYNENPDGAIWPTPVVGMVGKIAHPATPVTGSFKAAGDAVYLIGGPAEHLGASELLRWRTGLEFAPCPSCDLDAELATIKILVEANAKNLLQSAHDCSTGGLAVALSESIVFGDGNFGATLDVSSLNTKVAIELFAETAPRVVVSVYAGNEAAFLALCEQHGRPVHRLGEVTSDGQLSITSAKGTLQWSTADLHKAYQSTDSIFPKAEIEVPLH